MFRFTVLVPFSENTDDFEDTLASVLRYQPEHAEIIVVHDGSYEDPHGLSSEVNFVENSGNRQLIRLFNTGVQRATGDILVVARPGVELDENWHASVSDAFERNQAIGTVSPIILASDRRSKVVSAGIQFDSRFGRRLSGSQIRNAPRALSRVKPAGPTSWLAAYRLDLLSQIGPIDTDLDDHYLDAEVALSIQQLGFRCQLETDFVGLVDSDKSIVTEARRPHGTSAQRAFQRHGNATASGNMIASIVRDVTASPLETWLLRQAAQRWRASRWSRVDRDFSARLKQIRLHESWNEEGPSANVSFETFDQRRAA